MGWALLRILAIFTRSDASERQMLFRRPQGPCSIPFEGRMQKGKHHSLKKQGYMRGGGGGVTPYFKLVWNFPHSF